MNLDITLSINKRSEAQHNTFILKWDPSTSPYTMARFNDDLSEWAEGGWPEHFEWSIHEWQQAHKGDRFFLVRVGQGKTGLFAAGRFTSDPFKSEDWSGKGHETYFMQMEFEAVIHPERADIITMSELQQALPRLDWSKDHSGQLLEPEEAVRLELLWRDYVGRNKTLYLPRAVKNEAYDTRSDIDKAIEFASKAHAADYDLDGNPTILHPLAVGMMGATDTERIVGFLHDVVEDSRYDFHDLIAEGFSDEVIAALRLLTHDKFTPYDAYIERICKSRNMTAIHVKMNDLRHNLARGSEGGHHECVKRHTAALRYIEEHLKRQAHFE